MLVVLTCSAAAFAQQHIDSVSPGEGPIAGGTIVTLKGGNFSGVTVLIDRATVNPLSLSDSEVRLQMPKHDNGYALIQIGTAATEFLYIPPKLEDLPPGYITTVAGAGPYLRVEQPAKDAVISAWGLATAPNGDIYFMFTARGLVMRVRADGILQHVAGTLGAVDPEFLGDGGPAKDAFFWFPRSVALDGAGNLYVADAAHIRIRKIDALTGIVTTIAGNGKAGFSGDGGPSTAAQILEPTHLTCTPNGTVYFLDGNVRVRRIMPDGVINTVAGNGTVGESGDGGQAINAQLNAAMLDMSDLAVDGDGNLFILETDGQRVRKVDGTSGIITTFASRDGRGQPFNRARGLAIDPAGNVYVASIFSLDKFDRSGRLVESWFNNHGFTEDGAIAKQASIGSPQALAIAANGDIIYSDSSPTRIRKIDLATGKLETLAGIAPKTIGVPGSPLGAVFVSNWGDLAFLPNGDLAFADGSANWIFRIDLRNGTISNLGGSGYFGPGYEETPALATNLGAPVAIEVDSAGTLYFVDKVSVRYIDSNGIVHRATGGRPDSQCGFSGDGGPARDAMLCQPEDVAFDRAGNMFIADPNNNRIRRIDAVTLVMTTVAGSGPSNGFEGYGHGSSCGDGGPATSACMNTPIAVAVQDDGTLYINAFYNNPKIRKVTPDGIITSLPNWPLSLKLIVGPGQSIFGHGLTQIYRADNDRIRTIAGGSAPGFSGDGGAASQARMAPGLAELAQGLAIDAEGNLFFHDSGNRRIRAIRYGAVLAPTGAKIEATATGTTIRATVFDANNNTAPGVRVDFSSPVTGPTCALSNPFAITDPNGVASVTCMPSCLAGSYSVNARPLTATSSATVTMTNPGSPCRRRSARH
ncbi:MAG TPA: IPT/TIG domain-containing protein [Thermoanaerobaculia bacterium]